MIRNSEHNGEDKNADIEIPYSGVIDIIESDTKSVFADPACI
jgi:hypothetical protein